MTNGNPSPEQQTIVKRILLFPVLPQNDPEQAIRIRRFFMAFSVYLLCFGLAYASYLADVMEWRAIAGFLIIIPVINISFYIVFRTGLNRKMPDPSLTSIQMFAGILVTMYGMYYANESRGAMLLVYVMILIFGVYRLNTRRFLSISVFTLLTYGIDIALLRYFRPEKVNFTIEYLQWFVLALVLAAFSVIGGHISSLRQKLGKSLSVIRELSIHDELTGAYNRRHLVELLDYELKRAFRGNYQFSVAMLDIDHFKSVNDTYGHQTGDEVLRTVSKMIQDNLRSADFCGRYGGEEFLMVMTQTDLEGAMLCAERVRAAIEKKLFIASESDFRVTVSLGVTQYQSREDLTTLISRADQALYRAKRWGRNRVMCDQ